MLALAGHSAGAVSVPQYNAEFQEYGGRMAAFQPGAGLAKVTLTFSQGDGELSQNVFGVDNGLGSAFVGSSLKDLADAFVTWFGAGAGGSNIYKAFMASGASLISVSARDLTTVDAGEATVTANVSGTDGGSKLANGVTFTVTARTGLVGRSNRGRTYLTGLTANFVSGDPNVADAAHAAAAVLAFDALPAAVAAVSGMTLVVISRTTGGSPRTDLVANPVIAYGYHDLFMDYQRRRAPGHNRHR